MNQQDIGYRESLLLFVKDLGPTAKMIAEKKLLGLSADASKYQNSNYWFDAQKCHADMASNPAQWGPSTLNTISITPKSQNFMAHLYGQPSLIKNSCDRMNLGDTGKGKEATIGEVHASDEKNFLSVFGNYKTLEDWSQEVQLGSYSSTAGTGDLNCLVSKSTTMELNKGNLDHQAQILESASEFIKSNKSESVLKNSYSSQPSWPLRSLGRNGVSSFSQRTGSMHKSSLEYLTGHDQVAPGPGDQVWGSSKSCETLKSDQPVPQASQFIFDLPYLRTRLDQINSCSEGPSPSCAKMSTKPHSDNQQRSSLGTHHTDLALQL